MKKNKPDETTATEKADIKPSKKKIVLGVVKQYLMITLGCIIYSLGISLFVTPADLSAGGMTGISIIFSTFIPLQQGIILVILNIPMLILGLIFFGWKFLVSTGYATVGSSLLMALWEYVFGEKCLNVLPIPKDVSSPTSRVLICAVVGGVLFGVGMGLIFRMGASTAGTDIIVKLLRKRFRHLKTGMISLITDMLIVTCSLFVNGYDLEKLFYTALSTVVFTLVFDWVLYGGNSAKTVFIITARDKCESVINRILKDIDTGATILDAKGAYTKEDKAMIMCVVKPFLYPRLRDVVHEEDKKAFMIVSSAKEIYGEGYQNPEDAEL
ncbi:MAG: YitT family protein [Clostridia bacterium]|nr:YitT family protein [Clostridia bacterium]